MPPRRPPLIRLYFDTPSPRLLFSFFFFRLRFDTTEPRRRARAGAIDTGSSARAAQQKVRGSAPHMRRARSVISC